MRWAHLYLVAADGHWEYFSVCWGVEEGAAESPGLLDASC